MKIESEKTSKILEKIDEQFQIDWLQPHDPTWAVGADVSILTDSNDFDAIKQALKLSGAVVTVENDLDKKIKSSFSEKPKGQARIMDERIRNIEGSATLTLT